MENQQKKDIVQGLCKAVADKLCKHIDAGHLPADFDGIELRWMLAEIFTHETVDRKHRPDMRSRFRKYRKEVDRADYDHQVLRG